MSSPTQRSLKNLRDRGCIAQVTERWNAFAKIRQDLFGFIDILAVKNGEVIAVQTTSKSNMSARVKKILENETYHELKKANWTIEVHGWAKNKKGRYELTIKTL